MSFKQRILLLTVLPLLLMAGVIGVGWWASAGLAESQSQLFRERLNEARRNELRRLLGLARGVIDPILNTAALHPDLDPAPAQAEIKRILTDLRFDATGSFFLFDSAGVCLAHRITPALVGQRLLDHRDDRGCYVIRELLGVAAHGGGRIYDGQEALGCYVLAALRPDDAGGGFLRYRWATPGNGPEEEKLGLVELLPVWGWMIGTGLADDDIDQTVDLDRTRVMATINHTHSLMLAILTLTTLVVGLLVRQTNLHQGRLASRHLQSLVHHYIGIQIAERRRFSRDLHDGINQLIVAAKFRIEVALTQAAQGKAEFRESLTGALETLDTAITEVRGVSHGLRPVVLDALGLEAALKELLAEFTERTGIVAGLVYAWDRPALGEIVEITLYRVAQEALMNIEKHAQASHVCLELGAAGTSVRLVIKDDGRGFDPDRAAAAPGIGLASMRDRFELLVGQLRISSAPGQGTRIEGEIPVPITR
ncbi:MAG TPA: cache domain-containing protein [Lamprocystis sp. (in: g-proteobacteria)]|nr:cache domain-containing protein [Lamprocystis sp. (in: g-proteobacteria)]